MRTNLVLARVGASSLHPEWIDATRPRNWDLRLLPYQPIGPHDDVDCSVHDVIVGPKWTGIRQALDDWDGWRNYDRVWMPDDDIRTNQSVINKMFETAEGLGLELFAPALDETSHFAHFSTMRNANFFGRWVGFVEIMAPGFATAALDRVRSTLDLSETGWGWGLDSVWPKLLGYRNVAVIDGTAVTHTRPVGEMRDAELRARVLAESDHLFERYDCAQVHTTFGAFGEDLKPLDLSSEQLLVGLVDGWRYLCEDDPRILSWIAEFQRRTFSPPAYPVEGTPRPAPVAEVNCRLKGVSRG